MSLLETLLDDAEKLPDALLPSIADVRKVLGALLLRLDQGLLNDTTPPADPAPAPAPAPAYVPPVSGTSGNVTLTSVTVPNTSTLDAPDAPPTEPAAPSPQTLDALVAQIKSLPAEALQALKDALA